MCVSILRHEAHQLTRASDNMPLCLSEALLGKLKEWSRRPVAGPVSKEEVELAGKLHKDFARFPTSEALAQSVAEATKNEGLLYLAKNPRLSSAHHISLMSLGLQYPFPASWCAVCVVVVFV